MTKFEYKIEVIDKKGRNLVEFLNEERRKRMGSRSSSRQTS